MGLLLPVSYCGLDGKLLEMKCNESDATSMDRVNQELLEKVASLEMRLGSSRSDLELSNIKLERMIEEKSNFVSIISHELKTPLTGLKLFADLLLVDEKGVDEEEKKRYLAIISSEADRLSRMISNVAEFQNICSGDVQWHDEVVDVVNVVEKCARPFEVLCQSKGLAFSYDTELESLWAVLDKERLARVVYNLLSNALKFSRQGDIKLGLKMNSEADGFCLSVSDTGLGMSDDQQKKILLENTDIPPLGKGLGLYVSKYIVAHYQGKIWVESVVGKGAVFHVDLPLNRFGCVDD